MDNKNSKNNEDNNQNQDINEQAEFYLKVANLKMAVESFKDSIVPIISYLKIAYDECIKQGFSAAQAFEFATRYVLESCFHSSK